MCFSSCVVVLLLVPQHLLLPPPKQVFSSGNAPVARQPKQHRALSCVFWVRYVQGCQAGGVKRTSFKDTRERQPLLPLLTFRNRFFALKSCSRLHHLPRVRNGRCGVTPPPQRCRFAGTTLILQRRLFNRSQRHHPRSNFRAHHAPLLHLSALSISLSACGPAPAPLLSLRSEFWVIHRAS